MGKEKFMKKTFKKIGKIALIALSSVVGLVLLALGGLNVTKFIIYDDYYEIEDAVCKNPGLSDGFVCQGIGASEGNDVILVSGYMKDDSASRVYVTTTDNEARYVLLHKNGKAFTGHAGGIATANGSVYIASGSRIYTLSLTELLSAENGSAIEIGEGVKVNNEASFVYTDDTYLYVGEFHDGGAYVIEGHENQTKEGIHYAICSKYALSDLTTPVAVYSIRNKVQGICFTPNGKVVMSTSYGLTDSVYYVYNLVDATDSGKTFDGAPLYYLDVLETEVKGPAMAEGLDYYDGKIITLTESASDKYIFGKFFNARHIVSLDLA